MATSQDDARPPADRRHAIGRPRSEVARRAVLNAVDDLLVDVGYAQMTMKGIAERAGVSRQTVYRWWSTKAEILLEASATDAVEEMSISPLDSPLEEVRSYLDALVRFLSVSPAGAAYRALIGEAQHDQEVADLLASRDVLAQSARTVIGRVLDRSAVEVSGHEDHHEVELVGPVFFAVLSGRDPSTIDTERLARGFLARA